MLLHVTGTYARSCYFTGSLNGWLVSQRSGLQGSRTLLHNPYIEHRRARCGPAGGEIVVVLLSSTDMQSPLQIHAAGHTSWRLSLHAGCRQRRSVAYTAAGGRQRSRSAVLPQQRALLLRREARAGRAAWRESGSRRTTREAGEAGRWHAGPHLHVKTCSFVQLDRCKLGLERRNASNDHLVMSACQRPLTASDHSADHSIKLLEEPR